LFDRLLAYVTFCLVIFSLSCRFPFLFHSVSIAGVGNPKVHIPRSANHGFCFLLVHLEANLCKPFPEHFYCFNECFCIVAREHSIIRIKQCFYIFVYCCLFPFYNHAVDYNVEDHWTDDISLSHSPFCSETSSMVGPCQVLRISISLDLVLQTTVQVPIRWYSTKVDVTTCTGKYPGGIDVYS
jgi:hypothetical protein